MIAVVCVYNNKNVYAGHLLKSLQVQSAAFELIALDNTIGRFSSAAEALNYGACQTKSGSKYIMFAHQDIDLGSPAWLEETENMLDALPQLGIAGVAGSRGGRLLTNITHSVPPKHVGHAIREAEIAMTVDECCAIVPRQVFETHAFDASVCDGWHAYVVEYCLRIHASGLSVYVLPAALHHGSAGTLNRAYFEALKKVLCTHRNAYPRIHTTCGCWDARIPIAVQMGWFYLKTAFYALTAMLIARGLVPEWMQRKRRKRLNKRREQI